MIVITAAAYAWTPEPMDPRRLQYFEDLISWDNKASTYRWWFDYTRNHFTNYPDPTQVSHISDMYVLYGHAVAMFTTRYIVPFQDQHDAGPPEEWDDDLRMMFALTYPEVKL